MSSDSTNSILPILPEIVQNRTPADTSFAPIPCTASPIPQPPTGPLLSTRQLNAIPLILLGQSDEDVAESVGVRRQSICNWRNHHPRFIAELNRQRQLLHASLIDRYHHVLDRCLNDIVRFQEEFEYDTRVVAKFASVILRSATRRAFTPSAHALTNPEEILQNLLSQNLPISPEDSPAEDAPPPPPAPPKRRSK